VTHRVIWREQAVADLRAIFYSISDQADAEVALRFVQRIEAAGEKLTDFPKRGRKRDEIRAGLHSIPFRDAVTIFYQVGTSDVWIVRVIRARRDIATAFQDN
jgi:toxin ParE1/3/4